MSEPSSVAPFPHSRVSPSTTPGGTRELGTGALARQLGVQLEVLSGHWCSRCQGIWYGLLLEVQCPACGGRNG